MVLKAGVLCVCVFICGVPAMPPVLPVHENFSENEVNSYNFPFITRLDWSARVPKAVTPLHTPVPYVVIHHSYTPAACYDRDECCKAMRAMQNFHMDDRGWWDIGYSFGVGSDGTAFEGRGWESLGAHSLHFNNVSIGIVLIGDWTNTVPPIQQLKTTQALISAGVDLGYIKPDYKLIGHRQVRATECPGEALFGEIQTWPHYSSFPKSRKDLIHVKELSDSIKAKLANDTS